MKKIIALLLMFSLVFSFAACMDNENNVQNENNAQTEKRNVISVEITAENWSTYFVLKEEPVWMENDFGEVDGITVATVIKLRPEYYDIVAEESEIAFEVSGKIKEKEIDVDYSTKTYSLKESTGGYEGDFKETASFAFYENNYYSYAHIYACHIGYITDRGEAFYVVNVLENAQVTRAKGTLYLYE
ncbi:MAG: hypothetical protein E7608_06670 [Ruminococcaceae bacterium]|nr:hypothetical protein [Oscillospiraceae bacterium]